MRGVLYGHGHMGRIHQARMAERGLELHVVDPPLGLHDLPPWTPDFAIIATPTATHGEVAAPLLRAGIPCLVEKPLAASLPEAEVLAAFPHLSVGHVERFNPALAPLWGRAPRFVEAERLSPFRPRGTDVDVIADLMIHDLDLVLAFLPGKIEDVRAVGVGVLSGGADIVNARLEIGGAVANLTASRISRQPSRKLRVVEEGVYWSADLRMRTLHRVRWGEGSLDAEPVPVAEIDPVTAEHDAFLAAVRGDGPWICPGYEAFAAMALADRVRRALLPH